jgi:hypothetical protein
MTVYGRICAVFFDQGTKEIYLKREILIFSLIVRINREINKEIVSLLSFLRFCLPLVEINKRNRTLVDDYG